MRNSLCSRFRFIGLISLTTLLGTLFTTSAAAACYNTPVAALAALETSSMRSLPSEIDGYRVTKIRSDLVLGKRWAMISSCSHPEWPAFSLRANEAGLLKTPEEAARSSVEQVKTAPVVRAGDIVRLWRQESLLRIEVAGVSEENGELGKTIRVRLLRSSTDDQSIPEQFLGVVRGPSNVEIQP